MNKSDLPKELDQYLVRDFSNKATELKASKGTKTSSGFTPKVFVISALFYCL